MKLPRYLWILALCLFAVPAFADGTPVSAASQAEVNAGANRTKYVSPATLAGWGATIAGPTNGITATTATNIVNAMRPATRWTTNTDSAQINGINLTNVTAIRVSGTLTNSTTGNAATATLASYVSGTLSNSISGQSATVASIATNVLTSAQILNSIGFTPATNGAAIAYTQLPYAPGITNANGINLTNIPGAGVLSQVTNVTTTYTIPVTVNFVTATSSGGSFTNTLPASPPTGYSVIVKRTGANVVYVKASGSDTIDGSSSAVALNTAIYETRGFVWDGSTWWIW